MVVAVDVLECHVVYFRKKPNVSKEDTLPIFRIEEKISQVKSRS
jgi:hypothetical protein